MLLEERVGVLRTKIYRPKYQDINSTGISCGYGQLESIKHTVLECKGLNPASLEGGSDLPGALRF